MDCARLAPWEKAISRAVAVTTNFDNLVADAISIYTPAAPLVCGHELLTGFIRPGLNRPVIAKIHRDLLFNPASTPEEIKTLLPGWEAALNVIFDNNTPIVIGYGGNDGSLMGFLRRSVPIKGGMFWCYQNGHEPSQAIQDLVNRHHGRFVPIEGFDELMLRFAVKLQLESPLSELNKTHELRVENLTKQLTELKSRLKQAEEREQALQKFRSEMRPWHRLQEQLSELASYLLLNYTVQAATTLEEREKIYRKEAKSKESNPWFLNVFAEFLWKSRGNNVEANGCFQKALEIDPDDAETQRAYGEFLKAHPEFAK